MTDWTGDELDRIAEATELTIQAQRPDGTLRQPLPVWVVRDVDQLYVRSYRGDAAAWYRAARTSGVGRIRAGGVEKDVTFTSVADSGTDDRIDDAYRTKYRSYGAAYTAPMTAPAARATTLRLTPR
jgi:hypothetical protein